MKAKSSAPKTVSITVSKQCSGKCQNKNYNKSTISCCINFNSQTTKTHNFISVWRMINSLIQFMRRFMIRWSWWSAKEKKWGMIGNSWRTSLVRLLLKMRVHWYLVLINLCLSCWKMRKFMMRILSFWLAIMLKLTWLSMRLGGKIMRGSWANTKKN